MFDVIRPSRSEVIDTSGFRKLFFSVDTDAARGAGAVPDEMATALGRLILGKAVARADIDRLQMRVMELVEMDDIDATDPRQQELFGLEPTTNVVPFPGTVAAAK